MGSAVPGVWEESTILAWTYTQNRLY